MTMQHEQAAALRQVVEFARQHSPFYAEHFRHLPQTDWSLTDLPLVDAQAFWEGSQGLKAWPVLTAPFENGIVFKTGGTTGGGKLSVYACEEWREFVTSFSRSLSSQLQAGDRVANLFFAGDLYSSFLFIHGALSRMATPVCEYPFSGVIDPQHLTEQLLQHEINVLMGVPAMLLQYAATLAEKQCQLSGITTLLFGGESLFAGQIQLLKQVFPQARIASIGCASVDSGLIGASTRDCLPGEHRVFEPETQIEIIDETTGEPIADLDSPGMLVVTSLTRKLMPLIRYPTGDRAAWREPAGTPERKFVLLGRSSLGHRLRVGYASLFPDEIAALITQFAGESQWQLIIEQIANRDIVTLRIAFAGTPQQETQLCAALIENDIALTELIASGQLCLVVAWCQQADLQCNPRTGKLLRVVDKRCYTLSEAAQ